MYKYMTKPNEHPAEPEQRTAPEMLHDLGDVAVGHSLAPLPYDPDAVLNNILYPGGSSSRKRMRDIPTGVRRLDTFEVVARTQAQRERIRASLRRKYID